MTSVSDMEQTIAIRRPLLLWSLGLLLLVGLWLRLSFLLGHAYHYDEFISMLAAKMVAQRGLPILPSGIFYDLGLLYSLLAGAFVALFGFQEEVARWPTLLTSIFTIAAYYTTARRLFSSHLTGLLAAALVTFDSLAIVWGVRARMYTLAHLFVLLGVAWLLEGVFKRPRQRSRYLALAFFAAALLSHTIAFLTLPVLAILLILFTAIYRREWLHQPRLWQEAIVVLITLTTVLAVAAIGQVGSMASLQDPNANAPAPPGFEFLRGFFAPGLEWSRFNNLVGFFEASGYKWLLPIVVVSLPATFHRLLRRTATFADIALLFLALLPALVVFQSGALLTESWSLSRYLFITALPAFILLSAESLARILRWPVHSASRLDKSGQWRNWSNALVPVVGVVLVLAKLGPDAWDTAQTQATGSYNTAFAFVAENWQSGDKVMTVHPAAAYLYVGQNDYYANQATAKVLADDTDDNLLIDRYTGSPLLDSTEAFNEALADSHRVWFVVDNERLHSHYDPFFTQQVFAQMDIAHQAGPTYVFLSRPNPVPLQAEPSAPLNGIFSDLIRLEGYRFDPTTIAPDGTVSLGLYWRPIGTPTRLLKVFVHLRNGQGQTIAQADHFIYEGLLTASEWEDLKRRKEWLRDTADLRIPLPLPANEESYRIYVGLYDPDTFDRVPVLNDVSGENAVVIDFVPTQEVKDFAGTQ